MIHKTALLSCCLLLLVQAHGFGQVRLGVNLSRRSYIVGESITATLTIESQSTIPLVLGRDYHNAELYLELSGGRHGTRGLPDRRRVQRDLVIMPGSALREVVEITSLYTFLRPGNYRVNAVLVQEGRSFHSATFAFDVISGIEMRSFRQMLPGYSDIEIVYSFRYASREGREEAFMVIQSSDGRSLYGTFRLGPLLRMFQPVFRRREDGSIVVVHQSGRNRFSRSIFVVDRGGAEFIEQRHFRPDGTPLSRE